MADGLELQRYLLNREFDFWLEEGKYRSAERLFDLDPDSPEAEKERAWREHCLKRQNDGVAARGKLRDEDRSTLTRRS